MLVQVLTAAWLSGQAAWPPRIEHSSGRRDGLVIEEQIACPLSGAFDIRLGSDSRRQAFAVSARRHGKPYAKSVMDELNGWLADVGYLEYIEIGCTDDAAFVIVHSTRIIDGRGGSQSFGFAMNEDDLVRTPR